jgi:hypothetical protein
MKRTIQTVIGELTFGDQGRLNPVAFSDLVCVLLQCRPTLCFMRQQCFTLRMRVSVDLVALQKPSNVFNRVFLSATPSMAGIGAEVLVDLRIAKDATA